MVKGNQVAGTHTLSIEEEEEEGEEEEAPCILSALLQQCNS